MKRGPVARLAAAHLVNDVNQSAILGILPFLVAERGLGFAAASTLVTASQLSSAVVQPLLGHRADGRASRVAMPLALVVGAAAAATVGLVATGPATAAVFVGGVATAAFHPESARALRGVAGEGRSTALGIYSLGGNLGTALGPAIAAALVAALGWRGPALLVGLAAVAAWLVAGPSSAAAPAAPARAAGPPRWSLLARLVAILGLRSGFSACVSAFMPLYLVRAAGLRPGTAGLVLTTALLAGVAGAVAAARLADRFGGRAMLVLSLAPLGPLLAAAAALDGTSAVACSLLVGACSLAPYAIAVAAAQDCLPGREGLAAGIAMGVGSALGSVFPPLVGRLADAVTGRAGLRTALLVIAALPVVATLLASSRRSARRASGTWRSARRASAPMTR